jgi:hypothetical protein
VIIEDTQNCNYYGALKLPNYPQISGSGIVEWFSASSDGEAGRIAIDKAKEKGWL